MRLIWFEGPICRAHFLLHKEKESNKSVISISTKKEYEESVLIKDVFSSQNRIFAIIDDVDGIDSEIAKSCESWSDNDTFIFLNRKRTAWSKCCSIAKKKETFVEIPFKYSISKAEQIIRSKLNLDIDDGWITETIITHSLPSSWSKEVDAEKLEMCISMLEMTFSKRKPKDKTELGCALGYQASSILNKINDAHQNYDAIEFSSLMDVACQVSGSNFHAIQAVSSSLACKQAKLNLLKSHNANNLDIQKFKKNDGTALWSNFVINKFNSVDKSANAFANFLGSCESGSVVPYGAWGSLAWVSVMLHKSGSMNASDMSRIVSAYRSVRKGSRNGSNTR